MVGEGTNKKFKEIKIGKHIDLLTGFPFPSKKYSRNGIRLLRGSNIKRDYTDWSDEITKFWDEITPKLKKYFLEDGDIVIAMDGSLVGKSFARITKDDLPSLLLQRVARIRSESIDMNFLKEWICSKFFTKHCDSLKTASAIPHISPNNIRNFSIQIPDSKEEQSEIAKKLFDIEKLIINLENLIKKKKNIKQGTIQELLTGKRRLEGFNEEWSYKTFGELFNFLKTGSNSREDLSENGDFGYIHYGDIHARWNQFLDCDNEYIPKISKQKVKNLPLLQDGDLILVDASEDYVGIGACILLKNVKNKKIVSGLHTIFLRNDKTKLSSDYSAYLTSISDVKDKLIKITTGISVYGLSKTQLKKIEVYLPNDINEQLEIAKILLDMHFEIEKLKKQLHKYINLKQAMMQKLLTGEIRLV
jgi:type I restriction enzyme, S subunit